MKRYIAATALTAALVVASGCGTSPKDSVVPLSVGRPFRETIDLAALGPLTLRRASHVEPDVEGRWFADLTPVSGPLLGPFIRRSEALADLLDRARTAPVEP